MFKLLFPEESLGWLLLHAPGAGPELTRADSHVANSLLLAICGVVCP